MLRVDVALLGNNTGISDPTLDLDPIADAEAITFAELNSLYGIVVTDNAITAASGTALDLFLDEGALSEADQATTAFKSTSAALAYANAIKTAERARAEAFITKLNTLAAADITATANAVLFDVETGKTSLVDATSVAALAAINAGNAIDLTGANAAAIANATDLQRVAVFLLDEEAAMLAEAEAAFTPVPATDAILSDTLITSRLRLNIAASTESDSGVTFGMSVRVQQDEGNTNSFNAARFYAKSGGLELGVGNIYGVIDNMAGLYSGSVGLTGLGWGNVVSNFGSLAYSSGGAGSAGTKEAAEIIYSMGDYGFAVATDGTDTEYGVSATMSGWTVALSASDTDVATNSEWVATVGGSIGGVKVGLATAEAVNGDTSTTLSASFDLAAATSVTAYYNDDEANTRDDKSYGLGVVHGLGGGASLRGGIVSVNDQTIADFGVLFNF